MSSPLSPTRRKVLRAILDHSIHVYVLPNSSLATITYDETEVVASTGLHQQAVRRALRDLERLGVFPQIDELSPGPGQKRRTVLADFSTPALQAEGVAAL